MPNLLVVEDDHHLAEVLSYHVERAGHTTRTVHDGASAISCLSDGQFDLMLLDLVLPDMFGFDVLRSIREAGSTIPVIVMSARTDEAFRVLAFDLGAVDFLTKPFGTAELLAHIRARLRPLAAPNACAQELHAHIRATLKPDITLGPRVPLTILIAERRVVFNDAAIMVTAREFDLLRTLNQAEGRVVTKGELLRTLWHAPENLGTKTVDTHINTLRRKLRKAGLDRAIRTVHGIGWAWTLPDCVVQR